MEDVKERESESERHVYGAWFVHNPAAQCTAQEYAKKCINAYNRIIVRVYDIWYYMLALC